MIPQSNFTSNKSYMNGNKHKGFDELEFELLVTQGKEMNHRQDYCDTHFSYSYNGQNEDFTIYEDKDEFSKEGGNKSEQENHWEDRVRQELKTLKLRDLSNSGFGLKQNPVAEFDEEIDSLEIVPSLTFDEDEWVDLEVLPSKTFDEDEEETEPLE